VLRAIGLTRAVRGGHILRDVSFEAQTGSTTTLLGPSGSGKTSLLRLVMGLDRPDAGELHLGERCLSRGRLHVPPEQREISLVFQEFTLFPNLDVEENLAFGLRRPAAAGALVEELLELLEIPHLRHRRIDRLSGGEQQRVALARALAVRPRVLLMDEPFSNIDAMLRGRLFRRLHRRLRAEGITTLIATHDHKEAFYFSDAILVLKDGRLIDHNPPRLIYERPADAWVAEFFGDTNLLTGAELAPLAPRRDLDPAARYLVRPEALVLATAEAAPVKASVTAVEYYGAYQDVHLALDGGLRLHARNAGLHRLREGERVGVALHPDASPHPLP
jgi:iron(III) transport system ATP-binding protein